MPHIGIRAIDCVRPDGVTIDTVTMNPRTWLSSGVMAELLDGWTAQRKPGVDSRYARLKTTQSDKTALDDFGRFVDDHANDPPSLRLASLPLELVSDWETDLAARYLVDDSGERKVSNEPHVRTARLFAFIRGAAAIGIAVNPVVLDRAKHGPRARWSRHISGQVAGFTDDEDRALKSALLTVLYRALAKVRAGAGVVARGKNPEQHGWEHAGEPGVAIGARRWLVNRRHPGEPVGTSAATLEMGEPGHFHHQPVAGRQASR